MKLGNWFAVLGCVGVAVGVSIASQGCTATVTSGSGDDGGNYVPPGDDDDSGATVPQEDSGSVPPNACLECLYGQCAGLYSICVGDTGCLAIYECATATACAADTTGACVQACINAQAASSQALYDNLGICDYSGECNGGACAATCNPSTDYCAPTGDDDGGSDSGNPVADAGTDAAPVSDDAGTVDSAAPLTCDQCQKADCASEIANCASGTACFAYNECVLGCASADCVTICGTNSPAGVAAAKALGTCTTTNCAVCALPPSQ